MPYATNRLQGATLHLHLHKDANAPRCCTKGRTAPIRQSWKSNDNQRCTRVGPEHPAWPPTRPRPSCMRKPSRMPIGTMPLFPRQQPTRACFDPCRHGRKDAPQLGPHTLQVRRLYLRPVLAIEARCSSIGPSLAPLQHRVQVSWGLAQSLRNTA